MGSDDLYNDRRRHNKRKSRCSADPSSPVDERNSGLPYVHDIFQSGAFLNSSNIQTFSNNPSVIMSQPQTSAEDFSDVQKVMQFQYQAIMEWQTKFKEWHHKYGNIVKMKDKRRNKSARARSQAENRKTEKFSISIGETSENYVSHRSTVAVDRRPQCLLNKSCRIFNNYNSNYYILRHLNDDGNYYAIDTFLISDKHPLLDKFKEPLNKATKIDGLLNFISSCKRGDSSLKLNKFNEILWHFAGSVLKNAGTPDLKELANYFMKNRSLTKLLGEWYKGYEKSIKLSSKINTSGIQNDSRRSSIDYFISVRAWGAAFSLCGSDSRFYSYVEQKYIIDVGKLNPLSTIFSFINQRPIVFLKISTEEFISDYKDHLMAILMFGYINVNNAKLVIYEFAKRLKSQNLHNMAQFCYLIAGCYSSNEHRDDRLQLIGFYNELPNDLLDKDYFIESILLSEVIEYGFKQSRKIWANPIEYKLYIIRYLMEARNFDTAFLFAEEFALKILNDPEEYSKYTVYQLYAMSEVLFLSIKCYENTSLTLPDWLSLLKDVYKGVKVKFEKKSTSSSESLAKKTTASEVAKSSGDKDNYASKTKVNDTSCKVVNSTPKVAVATSNVDKKNEISSVNASDSVNKSDTVIEPTVNIEEFKEGSKSNGEGVTVGSLLIPLETVNPGRQISISPVTKFASSQYVDPFHYNINKLNDDNHEPSDKSARDVGLISKIIGKVGLTAPIFNITSDAQLKDSGDLDENLKLTSASNPSKPAMGKVEHTVKPSEVVFTRKSAERYPQYHGGCNKS